MAIGDCVICLDGLELSASIGIYPHEKVARQPVLIDLSLEMDGSLAGKSDDIRHTVDYDEVVEALVGLLANSHFNLLEHLSQSILELIGERFPVRRADVRISKPLAVKMARRVSVSRRAEWKREMIKRVAG